MGAIDTTKSSRLCFRNLIGVKFRINSGAKRSSSSDGRFREGFQMPAGHERVTQYRRPASESLRRTNAREAVSSVYGDLAGQRL